MAALLRLAGALGEPAERIAKRVEDPAEGEPELARGKKRLRRRAHEGGTRR
jgi:hypothetical protein